MKFVTIFSGRQRPFVGGLLVGSLIAIGVIFYYQRYRDPVEFLASCLTKRDVVMYGTDWCPHCQNQKNMFGTTFSIIRYVNCDFHQSECREKGITKYPTWYIDEEAQIPGVKSLPELARLAGCRFQPSVSSQ